MELVIVDEVSGFFGLKPMNKFTYRTQDLLLWTSQDEDVIGGLLTVMKYCVSNDKGQQLYESFKELTTDEQEYFRSFIKKLKCDFDVVWEEQELLEEGLIQ